MTEMGVNIRSRRREEAEIIEKTAGSASSRRRLRAVMIHGLWLLVAANVSAAAELRFKAQTMTLPATTQAPDMFGFFEIDNNGLADLLVESEDNRLLIYRQKASGFDRMPDQAVSWPAQTAWISPSDVDPHPGVELLMSTATGLVYLRQNGGVFESQPRKLISADQVFTSVKFPSLVKLAHGPDGTNDVIPVISARQAVLHQRTNGVEWRAGEPMNFQSQRTNWNANRISNREVGSTPMWILHVHEVVGLNPEEVTNESKKAEDEAIRKLVPERARNGNFMPSDLERLDVNGDGREDLVAWSVVFGGLDIKTDVFVFLRGADGALPEQPTRISHYPGFPLVNGPHRRMSPLCDLTGDGKRELVLGVVITSILSSGGLINALLSGTLDGALTIRSQNSGGFSEVPDASIPIKVVASSMATVEDVFLLDGDFNGDGRPDILTKGSDTQWTVQVSSTNGGWFATQPSATFQVPPGARLQPEDLNHDGLSDLVAVAEDPTRLLIFLSQQNERNKP